MASSVQKFAQTLTEKCLRINKASTKFTISLCPNGSGNRNNHFILIVCFCYTSSAYRIIGPSRFLWRAGGVG